MSLAFLHKKSWHTANLKNVEQVWLSEQKQAEDDRKLEAWKKDREEERQIMELKQLQRDSTGGGGGGAAAKERVDFLYEAPTTKKEEYLLGKAVEMQPEESDVKKVEHLPGSTFLAGQNNLSSAANEEFNKMSHDPLVQMRLEEQKALARIMSNPIKMKQIRGAVEERKHALAPPHKSDKHHKKEKKHKHKHKHKSDKHKSDKSEKKKKRRHSDSDDSDDSEDEDEPPRHSSSQPPPQAAVAPPPPPPKKEGFGLVRYSNGQKLEQEAAGEARQHGAESEAASGAAAFLAAERFEGARPGYAFRSGPSGLGYYREASASAPTTAPAAASQPPPRTTGAPGKGGGGARPGKGGGRPALSAEEKEARLRQMMADAESHDAQRAKRAKLDAPSLEDRHGVAAAAAAALEAASASAAAGDNGEAVPGFMRDVTSATISSSSVSDRINQQSHYTQRMNRAGAESFMKR